MNPLFARLKEQKLLPLGAKMFCRAFAIESTNFQSAIFYYFAKNLVKKIIPSKRIIIKLAMKIWLKISGGVRMADIKKKDKIQYFLFEVRLESEIILNLIRLNSKIGI